MQHWAQQGLWPEPRLAAPSLSTSVTAGRCYPRKGPASPAWTRSRAPPTGTVACHQTPVTAGHEARQLGQDIWRKTTKLGRVCLSSQKLDRSWLEVLQSEDDSSVFFELNGVALYRGQIGAWGSSCTRCREKPCSQNYLWERFVARISAALNFL